MAIKKVVLAYSGGLDTSVAIPWIQENYQAEVVTLTVDLGASRELESAKEKALKTGAVEAYVFDGKEDFINNYVFPALKAGALYQGIYPLATALGRPLIAKYLVEVAKKEGADAVAHGCTGKGNDQVRFDVSIGALAPQLSVIAPAREWGMSRDEEKEYAKQRDIYVREDSGRIFSIDENMWGRSIEGEDLEDPWSEPPEAAFNLTSPVSDTPDEPLYLEVRFEKGVPAALDGEGLSGVALVQQVNRLAGEHGVGRIDHIEDRVVGIKSREIYESPAAVVLHTALRSLEGLVLSKDQLRFKKQVAQEYAEMTYGGLWYTPLREDFDAYVESSARFVSGDVRLRLHKGSCVVVGRQSSNSLYSFDLSTYGKGDQFDHSSSKGFIDIYGLSVRNQAQRQGPKG